MQIKKSQGIEFEVKFVQRYNRVEILETVKYTFNRKTRRELAGFARHKFGQDVQIEFYPLIPNPKGWESVTA